MNTPSLRAARSANPLKGAPPAAGQSPFRGVRWHGLLRGLRGGGVRGDCRLCERRTRTMDH